MACAVALVSKYDRRLPGVARRQRIGVGPLRRAEQFDDLAGEVHVLVELHLLPVLQPHARLRAGRSSRKLMYESRTAWSSTRSTGLPSAVKHFDPRIDRRAAAAGVGLDDTRLALLRLEAVEVGVVAARDPPVDTAGTDDSCVALSGASFGSASSDSGNELTTTLGRDGCGTCWRRLRTRGFASVAGLYRCHRAGREVVADKFDLRLLVGRNRERIHADDVRELADREPVRNAEAAPSASARSRAACIGRRPAA